MSGGISFFFSDFFTSTAHGLLQVRGNLASCTFSTSTGVRTGCHCLISLSVSVSVCNIRRFYRLRKLHEADFTNPISMEAGEYGLTRGTCFFRAVSRWSRSPGCCGFSVMVRFGWGDFFPVFFFRFFFLRTHTTCCKYEAAPCLI